MLLALILAVVSLESEFIERYFEFHPTRATEEGRTDFDRALEDVSPQRLRRWRRFLEAARKKAHAVPAGDEDASIDRETLQYAFRGELFALKVRDVPGRDPLFWTGVLSDAVVYFLLREDQPLAGRIAALEARARQVPRLVGQAKAALGKTPAGLLPPELVALAAEQARELANLYGRGLAEFAPTLAAAGEIAGAALKDLAEFLAGLKARGSARLGRDYPEAFRVGLRTENHPRDLLPRFEEDLRSLRAEAAAEGRKLWPQLISGESPAADDKALLRRLFSLAEEQHDTDVGGYVRFWKEQIPQLERLARAVVTLPDPLTLRIFAAPSYLQGQAYGGVFSEGPYRPDGDTLLLLPVPPGTATAQERERFFRAFNRPFSRMIAAHEVMPGHYVQLKIAAHQPHPIRAIFPDQVYAEGWGTFAEEIMLDHGWGGPLELLAHRKKQLENCARAIVDVRVHLLGASREEVTRIVQEEALQDPQLAANMWRRTLISPPQIVTYHLGYRQIEGLYRSALARPGFEIKQFSDQLMRKGAIPLRHYSTN
jgi:hypothetical protein